VDKRKKAEELWNKFSACMEATVDFEELKPLLEEIKQYFGSTTPLGRFVNAVLLKESDLEWIELDSIRHILHEEWDDSVQKTDLRKSIEMKYG